MNNPLIIEYFEIEEEQSTGIHSITVPFIRFVYFDLDEDTGANCVKDIFEVCIPQNTTGPAYTALHTIDWFAEFDHIVFKDNTDSGSGEFATVNRADMTDNGTAMRICSYMMHMIWAHAGGYRDYEGSILHCASEDAAICDRSGIAVDNLFDAYRDAGDRVDHGPYLMQGAEAFAEMIKAPH